MKTTLVIMAAGIGSRFGGGVKQLTPVGPGGEIIIDYSIHDAIEAGFNKIVFIIRREIEADFREVIGERVEAVCARLGVEIAYAYQALNDLPDGFTVPQDRTKPWGTGHAVLTCRGLVREPFAVINADDYYGKEAYRRIHEFLLSYRPDEPDRFCMAGFRLGNTLSENGGVTRGICTTGEDNYLTDVVETRGIIKTQTGAEADGKPLDPDGFASMNMWGLTPAFIDRLADGFRDFLARQGGDPKAEFLLPIFIGQLLGEGKVSVKVLPTNDKWFGVTYKEDRQPVIASIRALVKEGVYSRELYGDL